MHGIQALDIALLRNHGSAWQYGVQPFMSRMTPQFGESDLHGAILASNGDLIPRRLSIRIRFPPCNVAPARGRAEAYLARLYREIGLVASRFDRDREMWQLLLGIDASGFLDVDQIIETLETLRSQFRIPAQGDVAIELDPLRIAPEDIGKLSRAGFTRVTLIANTLTVPSQTQAERMHGAMHCAQVIGDCHAHGIRTVAAHVFHSLPDQDDPQFLDFLDTITAARPHRVIEHGREHLDRLLVASADSAERCQLNLMMTRLAQAGYERISMHQYALPDALTGKAVARPEHHRNFLGLDVRGDCDLLGFGVGAFSQIANTYSQNMPDLHAWEAALDEGRTPVHRGLWLSEEDIIRLELTLQLMLHGEITVDTIEHVHQIDFQNHFTDAMERLRPLVMDGLVEIHPARITVTRKGRPWLRRIALCFDSAST